MKHMQAFGRAEPYLLFTARVHPDFVYTADVGNAPEFIYVENDFLFLWYRGYPTVEEIKSPA
jgi:hypothetical protein